MLFLATLGRQTDGQTDRQSDRTSRSSWWILILLLNAPYFHNTVSNAASKNSHNLIWWITLPTRFHAVKPTDGKKVTMNNNYNLIIMTNGIGLLIHICVCTCMSQKWVLPLHFCQYFIPCLMGQHKKKKNDTSIQCDRLWYLGHLYVEQQVFSQILREFSAMRCHVELPATSVREHGSENMKCNTPAPLLSMYLSLSLSIHTYIYTVNIYIYNSYNQLIPVSADRVAYCQW